MNDTDKRIRALPLWSGDLSIAPLKGGLSNESFIVSDDAGKHVVRFGQDFPVHHVSREHEAMVSRAAFESGMDGRWRSWIDLRSGLPTLVKGSGQAWYALEGDPPTVDELAARAEAFLEEHEVVLGRWDGQMVLDREASTSSSDTAAWRAISSRLAAR